MMSAGPSGLVRFTIVPPDTAPLGLQGSYQDLVISPDGTQVVYSGPGSRGAGTQLNLRPIDQLVGAPLRGGEGGTGPFVSPDGQWVGFVDDTTLQKMSIVGGPPVTLTVSPGEIRGATWVTDDEIIFGTAEGGLFRVSGGGGEPEALTTADAEQGELDHRWPFRVPGANAVLFVIRTGGPPVLTNAQLAALDLDTTATRRWCRRTAWWGVWSATLVSCLITAHDPTPPVHGCVVFSCGRSSTSTSNTDTDGARPRSGRAPTRAKVCIDRWEAFSGQKATKI